MRRSFFLAVYATLLVSCSDENVDHLKRVSLNTSFTSQMLQKVYITDTLKAFTLEVNSISDNRCSLHTEHCLDKGLCAVRIKLSNLDNASAETILSIDNSAQKQSDTVLLNLDKKTYKVFLNSVNPKPSESASGHTPKTAEFIVREYHPE